MEHKIFCVEDDDSIRQLLICTLESFGYKPIGFEKGEPLLKEIDNGNLPELFLLDIMLPDMDGIEILKKIRLITKTTPVIMLTAKTQELDIVTGLDNGADDYITKPFSILELNSRIKAALRRNPKTGLVYNDIEVCLDKYTVLVAGNKIDLTLKEYELLKLLITNKDKVVSRDEILEKVWGFEFAGETRTLDMHIKTLRQKLGESNYIKTVRGVGYSML